MNLIFLLLSTVFANSNPDSKVRLAKKPDKVDARTLLNQWVERNFYLICLATIVILLLGFVMVCFAIVGVSATDSGILYNHLGDV